MNAPQEAPHHTDADVPGSIQARADQRALDDIDLGATGPRSQEVQDWLDEEFPPEGEDNSGLAPPPDQQLEIEAFKTAEKKAQHPGITKSYASLCEILRKDRRVLPTLRWNEMAVAPVSGKHELEDHDTDRIRERIELTFRTGKKGLEFKSGETQRAIMQVAHETPYHPVREYLSALKHDGEQRIDRVCKELLGLERSPLHLALIRRWFIGSVARIFDPGCELQMVLVFTGDEDRGKSKFFKALVGEEWFSDSRIRIDDKDSCLLLQRVWMLEWGELAAIGRANWEEVKAFITSTTNDFRAPYGHKLQRALRHCVIVGTSNNIRFLRGLQGERRFWPLAIPRHHKIPLDLVAEWRDQLWAEAVQLYNDQEQWHLTDEEKVLLKEQHQDHTEPHPWEGPIAEWLQGWTGEITSALVLEKAIHKPTMQWTPADTMVVGECLRALGYERVRRRVDGQRTYLFIKAGTVGQEVGP